MEGQTDYYATLSWMGIMQKVDHVTHSLLILSDLITFYLLSIADLLISKKCSLLVNVFKPGENDT